jgi:hypothetical protein
VTTGVDENDIVPDKVCEKELVQDTDTVPVKVGEPDHVTVGEPVIVTFGEAEKELYETIHV